MDTAIPEHMSSVSGSFEHLRESDEIQWHSKGLCYFDGPVIRGNAQQNTRVRQWRPFVFHLAPRNTAISVEVLNDRILRVIGR